MRINELTIKNFKSFSEKTFEFNDRFNVIIGNNATGKTTILDALSVAIGSFLLGIDGADSKNIRPDEIRTIWKYASPLPQVPVIVKATGDIEGKTYHWMRTLNSVNGRTTRSDAKVLKGHAEIKHDIYRNSENQANNMIPTFPLLAYHGTGRLWAEHSEKIDYKANIEGVLAGYKDCLSPKSSSKAFLSWYKTYYNDAKNLGNDHDLLLLIVFNSAITEIIPEWKNIGFSYKIEDLVGDYTNPDGSEELKPFSSLSDGFRNTIGLIADLAYRCIKLNPHLGEDILKETPGVVLIDEIDLHLHPKWQKRIVEDLKRTFPKVQFIATTHSPFVVQSLTADQLINLDNMTTEDAYHLSIEEVAENIMGMENVKRSQRFIKMENSASAYFTLLRNPSNQESIDQAKNLYDELKLEFENDPAYLALLKAEGNSTATSIETKE